MTVAIGGDDGSTATQVAIVTPVLMLVIMAIIHFAVYFHAEHIVQAAAAQAVSTAGAEHGDADDGRAEAQRVLDKLASGFLQNTDVEVARGATDATVRISGAVVSVMPFLHLHVAAEARGPVETAVTAP